MPLLSNLLAQDIPKNFYKFQLQIYAGFFFFGLLGFIYLMSPIVSRRTYLSENALSPGLVSTEITVSSDQTRSLMAQLQAGFKDKNIANVIQSMLLENGIEAYKQSLGRNTTDSSEENVYGIIRAPRLASTESIILVAPLHVRTQISGQAFKANLFGKEDRARSTHFFSHIVFQELHRP
jgi:hypothetical protein